MVARAIPGIWELISPAEALRVRLEGAADALHRLLAGLESDALAAADRLWRVAGDLDLRWEDMQPVRGWTDEHWDAARSRLVGRGWIGPDGELTSAGRAAHADVEDATDRAATRPWARIGTSATAELADILTRLAQACASVMPYPSPIGVPAPAPRA